MDAKELVEHFISNSKGFHDDLDLQDIDDKHSVILQDAYNQIMNAEGIDIDNFRNWKGQSDLSVPAQMSFNAIKVNGLVNVFLRYFYKKIFMRKEDQFLLSTLLDDLEIIKQVGAEKYLLENPVHLTPGVGNCYTVSGTSVNVRWLRYIYFLKKIQDLDLLSNGGVWVDVGSFYGGLQGLVRKYNPKAKIILVDFHHQLCRSYIYLSHLYPDATHILPDQFTNYKNIKDMPEGGIMYVPVSEYDKISEQKADLATNFFSLGEMRKTHFENYMLSKIFSESDVVYMANRFVSSPFFEKTYDTDVKVIDYLSLDREVKYFDVFPIHHYNLSNRVVLGRKFFRSIASPYFELLTVKYKK